MSYYSLFDINIYQIQMFLAVAEEGNFSKAAIRLNLTQPTLSKRISILEGILGVSLFDRDKRPVILTEAGTALYAEWKNLVRDFELSVEIARQHQDKQNRLSVCTMDSARLLDAIPYAGYQMEQDYPGISFSWEYESFTNWKNKLYSGGTDIMLTLAMEFDNLDAGLLCEQVMVCPKLVCVLDTNPLSQKESISYKDLEDQYFVVNSLAKMPAHYNFLLNICKKHGFEPKIARYVSTPHALVGNLRGDNEALVCDIFLRDIESPRLKRFELPDTYSGMLAVWKKDNSNPLIRPYIEKLKSEFTQRPPTIL